MKIVIHYFTLLFFRDIIVLCDVLSDCVMWVMMISPFVHGPSGGGGVEGDNLSSSITLPSLSLPTRTTHLYPLLLDRAFTLTLILTDSFSFSLMHSYLFIFTYSFSYILTYSSISI